MKDCVELTGYTPKAKKGATKAPKYTLVPSGNHRNQQRVQIAPLPGASAKAGQPCPICKKGLRAWVQTFPTKDYEAWTETAVYCIRSLYKVGQFTEPVIICAWIFGGKGFMESRDWDNVKKCVGDALAAAKVLPVPDGPELKSGNEREGGDDVRSVRGWRTHYLTKEEHAALVGARKADDLTARLFVKLVPASEVDPFRI